MPYRAALSILLFASLGCTSLEPRSGPPAAGPDTGTSIDGGGVPSEDELWANEGAVGGGLSAGTADFGEGRNDSDSCFDGIDNDGTGFADCLDPSCASVPACRVGSGRLCAVAAPTELIPEAGCTDGALARECLSDGTELFGSPSPWVGGGGIHPGGDAFDSGFYRNELIDLRSEHVVVSANILSASCVGDPMDPCVETVAFGITAREEFDASTRVRPIAALEYRAARNEVALVLDDITVFATPFGDDLDVWSLDVTPEGEVLMLKNGDPLTTERYAPRADARVVAFGRNTNRGAGVGEGARLSGLTLHRAACDIPDAWVDRGESTLQLNEGGAPYAAQQPTGISVATGPEQDSTTSRRWVAFSDPGTDGKGFIFTAFVGSGGPAVLRLAHSITAPALPPTQEHEMGGVLDPELFYDGAAWHLYYTAVDKDGLRSIGHAVGADPRRFTADVVPALTADGWSDIAELSMPTVAVDAADTLILVARAELTEGGHTLAVFFRRDGSFLRVRGALEGDTLRGGRDDGHGFDADEVAQPSLALVEGAFHLYYAGRRGTRWGVGMLASPNMVSYREVADGRPVLSAGTGSSPDALGVVGLDLEVVDGSVMAFYDAFDGRDRSIGYAARPAPGSL